MQYYEYGSFKFKEALTGHCDWKDWRRAHNDTKKILIQMGIDLDISNFGLDIDERTSLTEEGLRHPSNVAGEQTSFFFVDLDAALIPLGYEVANIDTRGDYYSWSIVKCSE